MDIVIVTHAPDAHLLRWLLASYELYYETKNSLILFVNRSEDYLWKDIPLPANAKLIYRDDLPELGSDGFKNQIYLKLIAHRYVTTEHFLLLDSDFLFVAPCNDDDFLHDGKPSWFYRAWNEGGKRWRAGSETFAGSKIELQFMEAPQYVFSREIAREFEKLFDLKKLLLQDGASEYVLYGWFAHTRYNSQYEWIDLEKPARPPAIVTVNQVPPTYQKLDPNVSLADFKDAKCVVFWSHWSLAEKKMDEFFHDSQQLHFGKIKIKLPPLQLHLDFNPAKITAGDFKHSGLNGIDEDGWFKEETWFGVPPASRDRKLIAKLFVTMNDADPTWRLDGSYSINGKKIPLKLPNLGSNEISIPLPAGIERYKINLFFPNGFRPPADPTGRTLRARLESLDLL